MRKDVLNGIEMLGGDEGLINKSAMAKRFNCDRKTVNKYINQNTNERPTRKYTSKLDSFKGIIIDKVNTYDSSAMAVYRFIKKQGYTGKYGIIRKFVEEHVKEETHKATIRFETSPGLQAQVDWKEKFKLVSKDGTIFQFNVFLMILGYSRYKYFEVTSDMTQKTLFRCMINAFRFFGGVPKEILFDNMPTVVDRAATTFRTVVINKDFANFAKDMGFAVKACKRYRPQTKGKVEATAKLIENLRPYNAEFDVYDEIVKIVDEFNMDINDEKQIFLDNTPKILLKKETEFLNSIPCHQVFAPYFVQEKQYKVSKESMITYKGKKYSVPIRFIGKYTTVDQTEEYIHIYYTTDVIATHRISDKFLNYTMEHAREILKSDALKGMPDNDIDKHIKENLYNMDRLLITERIDI